MSDFRQDGSATNLWGKWAILTLLISLEMRPQLFSITVVCIRSMSDRIRENSRGDSR
ncbi:hypothetical protein [Allocoleopsis sp.]|uniref:hypothetical protein n=1 Tax=Allocoleopsis sp. TaxID=3088169 RepID=UPI002FD5F701